MDLIAGMSTILKPDILVMMVLGVILGVIFGSIPGLTSPAALALVLPMTYAMETSTAFAVLVSVYIGGMTGGLISAILLRMPGTSAAIATVFDGYPMAKKGQPSKALGLGITASIFGGLFSWVALYLIAPQLTKIALKFGEFEFFALVFFALTLVSVLLQGQPLKGLIAMLLALLLTTVGASPVDGARRFTFGIYQLDGGFDFLIVIIGAFALSEIFASAGRLNENLSAIKPNFRDGILPKPTLIIKNLWNMVRSSIIGTFIGIMPGLGGAPAALMAYAQAKKSSKHPEQFGQGIPEGILAVESANNAVTGGALIPMLTLGIPGYPSTALLMAGFMIQGVDVGPLLFTEKPDMVNSIMSSVLVANIIMFVIMMVAIRFFVMVLRVPKSYLLPYIIVFCTIGAFSIGNQMFDVYAMLAFGILGYILEKNDYPLAPFTLAFLLGNLFEHNFRRTQMNRGSILEALMTPSIGSVIFVLAIVLPIVTMLLDRKKKLRAMNSEDLGAAEEVISGNTRKED